MFDTDSELNIAVLGRHAIGFYLGTNMNPKWEITYSI